MGWNHPHCSAMALTDLLQDSLQCCSWPWQPSSSHIPPFKGRSIQALHLCSLESSMRTTSLSQEVCNSSAGLMEIGETVAANMLCLFSPQRLEAHLAICRTKMQMGSLSFFSSALLRNSDPAFQPCAIPNPLLALTGMGDLQSSVLNLLRKPTAHYS